MQQSRWYNRVFGTECRGDPEFILQIRCRCRGGVYIRCRGAEVHKVSGCAYQGQRC